MGPPSSASSSLVLRDCAAAHTRHCSSDTSSAVHTACLSHSGMLTAARARQRAGSTRSCSSAGKRQAWLNMVGAGSRAWVSAVPGVPLVHRQTASRLLDMAHRPQAPASGCGAGPEQALALLCYLRDFCSFAKTGARL